MKFENDLKEIIKILHWGGVVCLPTDTLFAISCDATSPKAVEKLYRIKKRNLDKKLPIFFSDLAHVKDHCRVTEEAEILATKFWPGKLTIVLELEAKSTIARNAMDTKNRSVAVRVPGDASVLEIVKTMPIVGTSANVSGDPNVVSYEGLERQFENCDVTIFKPLNYEFKAGLQSTIVSFDGGNPLILREGAISKTEITRSFIK